MWKLALAFIVFAALFAERGTLSGPVLLCGIAQFLVYPHLAYLHTRIARDSKRAELAAALRDKIAPALIGQDALNQHRLIELFEKITPTQPGAVAGIEMACVELAANLLDVPLYTYLGGAVTQDVQFNGWIGALPPDEAAAEAKKWLDAGFKSAKIKVGGFGIQADHDRVAAVRAAVGSAMKLRMDANCLYDAKTSLELCKLVKQYDMQLYEQPAPKEDLEGLAKVRRVGGIAVMYNSRTGLIIDALVIAGR